MTNERTNLLRSWWDSLDPYWMRFFKIQLNTTLSSDKSARDRFTPSMEELDTLVKKEELSVSDISIKDLSPLKVFQNLKALKLSRLPHISSLQEISEMPEIRHLELQYLVCDLSPITRIQKLEILILANNGLHDLLALNGLNTLTTLRLNEDALESITGISGQNLQELIIKGGNLKSLDPVAALLGLRLLTLENVPITSIEPIKYLTALHELVLTRLPLVSLDGLEKLIELEKLDLSESSVQSIANLRGLRKLKSLNINGTQVKDLEPLYEILSLEQLHLSKRNFSEQKINELRATLSNCNIRGEYQDDLNIIESKDFEIGSFYKVIFEREIPVEFQFLEKKATGEVVCQKHNGEIFDFNRLNQFLSIKKLYIGK